MKRIIIYTRLFIFLGHFLNIPSIVYIFVPEIIDNISLSYRKM